MKNNKEKSEKKATKSKLSPGTIWTLKITFTTFFIAVFVSFVTQIASTESNLVVSFLLLIFLIVLAILFDAIGVAATGCDMAPLLSMASKRVKGAKIAVKLVKNAEKVANICNDVIGDMAGIISGTCSASIIFKLTEMSATLNRYSVLLSIVLSSLVSAVTVGGKAFFKSIAMKNSKELMLLAGRVLSVFERKQTKKKKK